MTITVDRLIAEYAQPIAVAVNATVGDYDSTADGFAALLRDTADRLSPRDHTREWLDEAADGLAAISLLGDSGPKTQKLLESVDQALYEAKSELELY